MPLFKIEWSLTGSAVVEADDQDEAEALLAEGLVNLDSGMCESLDVDEVTIESCEPDA